MAYDAGRGFTVLFGGENNGLDLGETWIWTGSGSWQRVDEAGGRVPSARLSSMAYDVARESVVLFGGAPPNSPDTWEWRPSAPGVRMAARLRSAFGVESFDCGPDSECPIQEVSVRARAGGLGDASTRVRLFDGEAGEDLDRTWVAEDLGAFDGSGIGAFTLRLQDHVGGDNVGTLLRWCVRVNGVERCEPEPFEGESSKTIPADFPLYTAINVFGDLGELVEDLEVEVHVEHPDTSELTIDLENAAAPGIELQVWNGFDWESVDENDAHPDTLSPVDPDRFNLFATFAEPARINQLLFGETVDTTGINLRLKPKHPGGKRLDLGRLVTDYVEVRVRYRHPRQIVLGGDPIDPCVAE